MAEYIEFIDCTTLSISYDIMGVATVSYTLISNYPGIRYWHPIDAADQTFTGYVASIDMNPIVDTEGFNENHVTLITTTDGGFV